MRSNQRKTFWQWWCSLYYLGIEQLKGASTVVEIFWPARLKPKMTATSVMGYRLEVYCQRKHYARRYTRLFVPTRHHIQFQVYSTVSADAPPALKTACEIVMSISSGTHWSVDSDYQEKLAVDAYLDLLAAHLRRTNPAMNAA
jgi:hypothetical protein